MAGTDSAHAMTGAGITILVADLTRSGEPPAWWRDAVTAHGGREIEGAGQARSPVFPSLLAAPSCASRSSASGTSTVLVSGSGSMSARPVTGRTLI